MVITDYRVQSILRTYTRQLQRSRAGKVSPESGDQKPTVEKVSISDEGRRRSMMERLSNQVFEKMYSKQDNGSESAGEGSKPEAPAVQERE
ncbi:MAG: DVU0524 family FlgM-associated protein [Syntrophobacteraceae bacterium]